MRNGKGREGCFVTAPTNNLRITHTHTQTYRTNSKIVGNVLTRSRARAPKGSDCVGSFLSLILLLGGHLDFCIVMSS